jgi:hypothetical protein
MACAPGGRNDIIQFNQFHRSPLVCCLLAGVLTNNFYFNLNISALAERAQLFGLSPAATDIFQLVSWPSKQTTQ